MLKDLHKRLRPMGILDILDETAEIYKRNFVLLVGIAAFLYVPLFLFQASMQRPALGSMGKHATPEEIARFGVMVMGSAVIYLLATMIVTGALTFAISDRYLERETTIGACYKRVLKPRMFFSFIWANVLVGIIAMVAMIPGFGLLIVLAVSAGGVQPGAGLVTLIVLMMLAGGLVWLYVMLRLTLVTPSFFVETGAAWAAIKRSWQLMKGSVLKALGLLLITTLFVFLIEQLVTAPFQLAGLKEVLSGTAKEMRPSLAVTLLSTVISTLLMPVSSIVLILLYYDMRIRKEGFDLELLARDLDERSRAFAAEGAAALPQEQTPPPPPQEPPPSTEGPA